MDILKPLRPALRKWTKVWAHRVVSRGYPGNNWAAKAAHFARCLEFIGVNGIEGDILEFGVSRGGGLLMLDRHAQFMRARRKVDYRLFGFDSFEGLPEPTGHDRDIHGGDRGGMVFDQGRYKATKDQVLKRLRRGGADLGRIRLVEGWYDRVLTDELRAEHAIERATLIDIDCDLYESTVTALRWCEPAMRHGTIVSFDDWMAYEGRRDHGERRAFSEFLEQHPDIEAEPFSSYSWHGRAFLIHR